MDSLSSDILPIFFRMTQIVQSFVVTVGVQWVQVLRAVLYLNEKTFNAEKRQKNIKILCTTRFTYPSNDHKIKFELASKLDCKIILKLCIYRKAGLIYRAIATFPMKLLKGG